jgi:plasmid replication initiation protein
MKPDGPKKVAAIANKFIQHARYKLTPREQKLILYMATLLKPEDSDFEAYLVPVSEIEHILKTDTTKKHGSFYERLDELLDSITDKKITFPTDFTIDGVRLRGHINWVAGAVPKYDENGNLCVEFGFSPQMKPFLLGLKEKFTRFEFLEVARMKSGFSIRIYQMCKSYYYENIRHGRNTMAVSLGELKQRLGISDKYPDFRNFRRKVLDVARNEINEKTRLHIEYDFVKKGRNISGIRIIISENAENVPEEVNQLEDATSKATKARKHDWSKLDKRVEHLTEAQRRAFNMLTDLGLGIGQILDDVFPIIKGSELKGYEDLFVYYMIDFFKKKTTAKTDKDKARAFLGWVNNRRFEEPNLYARLVEKVIARKKNLKEAERSNREIAKGMTAAAFRKLLNDQKQEAFTRKHNIFRESKADSESRVGETNLFSALNGKEESREEVKKVFDYSSFKKEYADVYKRIRRDRRAAFVDFKNTPNYRQLLENSVKSYCEKWFEENA